MSDDLEAACTAAGAEENHNFPRIRLDAGEIPEICDKIEAALLEFDKDIFQRDGGSFRTANVTLKGTDGRERRATVIKEVSPENLRDRSMRHIIFVKKKGKELCVADPKIHYFTAMRDRGAWEFPQLGGIIHAPTLRADGSILENPGYDPQTTLYFDPKGESFPKIPLAPSREEALSCLASIKSIVTTFPFKTSADLSVFLAAFLTSLVRRTLPNAPAFGFDAPTPGSGKSKLVDLLSIASTGETAAVIAPGPEDELVKNLCSQLISGQPLISIDNLVEPFDSVQLCQMLTQDFMSFRLFHTQRIARLPTNVLVTLTGTTCAL